MKSEVLLEAVKKHEGEQTKKVKLDYDGKICPTASINGRIKKKDHITVVCGLTHKYVEHFTPKTGSGRNVAAGMMKVIVDTDSVQSLRAIGCGMYDLTSI